MSPARRGDDQAEGVRDSNVGSNEAREESNKEDTNGNGRNREYEDDNREFEIRDREEGGEYGPGAEDIHQNHQPDEELGELEHEALGVTHSLQEI
jgi:hypothetical protein